ncbi:F-box only protein 44-like [Centroberyx gerrardi]
MQQQSDREARWAQERKCKEEQSVAELSSLLGCLMQQQSNREARWAQERKCKEEQSVAELSSLLGCLMQQQSDREARWEQERKRQEERWKKVQHQLSQLQQEVRQDRQKPAECVTADPVSPSSSASSESPITRNLLKNPSGEEQFEFWELTENSGDHWKVEELPGDCGHDFWNDRVTKYFVTSFVLCLKRQVIDLLVEGYSPDQLDAQPNITVEDWYCGRTDCGCTYQLTVSLLDENQEVLQEFKPDPVTLDPAYDDCSWKQVSHTFSDYGPGLRFVSFEHGGQDTKYWAGWYGVRVTGSSVAVEV